jgi:F-type H+-transporting ATPase subunit b
MATTSDHGQVEGTLAHGGEPHGKGPFPPFDPANFTPLLIWLVLTFGLLYLLMSKIALPRVENILHTRSAKIRKDISDALAARGESERAAAELEKTIADARAKAQALAQETHARLNAETEAKRQGLEANLNAQLAAAEVQIGETKKQAMSNVGTIAGEAAAAIIAKLTGKPADSKAIASALSSDKA